VGGEGSQQPWYLYLLECENGYLYAGITTDVERRYEAHRRGKGARFTRINPPLRILGVTQFDDRSAASVAEPRLKGLSRREKLRWAQQHPYR
jgi:putative endonuclease